VELKPKELELAAVSISIAAGCMPCTKHHVGECEKLDAGTEEIIAATRCGAAMSDAALRQLWCAFDPDVSEVHDSVRRNCSNRQSVLCGIGAAVARNNVELLRQLIRQSRSFGISDSQIMEVIGLADRIKARAASHLETLVDQLDADRSIAARAAGLCS
jgi:alkylhydroperoxidase/carboxymuconolactone decarboxylase family protein YurZ